MRYLDGGGPTEQGRATREVAVDSGAPPQVMDEASRRPRALGGRSAHLIVHRSIATTLIAIPARPERPQRAVSCAV